MVSGIGWWGRTITLLEKFHELGLVTMGNNSLKSSPGVGANSGSHLKNYRWVPFEVGASFMCFVGWGWAVDCFTCLKGWASVNIRPRSFFCSWNEVQRGAQAVWKAAPWYWRSYTVWFGEGSERSVAAGLSVKKLFWNVEKFPKVVDGAFDLVSFCGLCSHYIRVGWRL